MTTLIAIIVIAIAILVCISACVVSGNWDDWDDVMNEDLEYGKNFTLKEVYWFIKSGDDGKPHKEYIVSYTSFKTYDKLIERLNLAVFNRYFESAEIERNNHGNKD